MQAPLGAEFVQHLDDVFHLETIGPADEVGPIPADGDIGMAAFGTDDRLHAQLLRHVHHPLHQLAGDIRGTDLNARVGRLEGLCRYGPGGAGMIHYLGHGTDEFMELHDLRRGQHQQVLHTGLVQLDLDAAGLGFRGHHLFQGLGLDPHGAADIDGTDGRFGQSFGGMSGHGETLAYLAHHVGDIVTHGTDSGTAPTHGAAVVHQFLPGIQVRVGHSPTQSKGGHQLAPEGVFLLPDATQGLHLVDGRVLGIAGLGIEQAGIGTKATVDTAVEIGGDGRVDLFHHGLYATFHIQGTHN